MVLELVASRVLSPYFGNSNFVWTSVIGIILLSTSIGNYFGGKIADKYNKSFSLRIILLIGSTLVLLIPFVQKMLLTSVAESITSVGAGAIICTIVLFFLPSMCIGLANPIIFKLKLDNLESAGRTAGKLNAIATIGGILGTFLGGFVLIPYVGSTYIIFVLAMILALLVLLVDLKLLDWLNLIILPILIISSVFMGLYINQNAINKRRVLNGEIGCAVEMDTEYGRVKVYNTYYNDKLVRVFSANNGLESMMYLDDEYKDTLVFPYNNYYDYMFATETSISTTLLIGGGGFTYPRHFLHMQDQASMDVVEIDPKVVEIAYEYFDLAELTQDYSTTGKRLNIFIEDGRVYLNRTLKKYDAILNDSFTGAMPALILTTIECIQKIKSCLTANGLYMTNIIGSLEGKYSRFLHAEVNTLKQVFQNVYIIPCATTQEDVDQNIMVIATDQNLYFENAVSINLSPTELVLTDAYDSIEQLVPKIAR